jgi:hypothetical protein
MIVLFAGNGRYDFPVKRPRVYEDGLAAAFCGSEAAVQRIDCLAMLVRHDGDPYDLGQSIALAAFRPPTKAVAAGYMSPKDARRFRKEVDALGIGPDDSVFCRATILGGEPLGRFVMPYRMRVDLAWPLRQMEDWYDVAAPFLNNAVQG